MNINKIYTQILSLLEVSNFYYTVDIGISSYPYFAVSVSSYHLCVIKRSSSIGDYECEFETSEFETVGYNDMCFIKDLLYTINHNQEV